MTKISKKTHEIIEQEGDVLFIGIVIFTTLQLYGNLTKYLEAWPRFIEIWMSILKFLFPLFWH